MFTAHSSDRPWMLRPLALLAAVVLLVVGAFGRQGGVVVFAAVILAVAGLGWAWAQVSTWQLGYRRKLSETRAFPDELVTLTVEIGNPKVIPVPWLRADDGVPLRIAPDSHRPTDLGGPVRVLGHLTALSWYASATWRHELRCRARGDYLLGPVRLQASDPFGFFTREVEMAGEGDTRLIVYPRIVPLARLGLADRDLLGSTRLLRPAAEDPSRAAGIRPYQPGDPLRRVHWKATARRGEPQVRLYDSTTTLKLALCLDAASFDQPWMAYRETLFELAVTAVASIAAHAIDRSQPAGLWLNGGPGGLIPPGGDSVTLTSILELLARAMPQSGLPTEEWLEVQRGSFSAGTTVVLATTRLEEPVLLALRQLRRAGHGVALLAFELDPGRPPPSDVPIYHLTRYADLARTLAEAAGR